MTRYNEVRRAAKVGERVRFVYALYDRDNELIGKEYIVDSVDSYGDVLTRDAWLRYYEYAVLEPIDEEDDTSLSDAELVDVVIRLTKAVVDLEKTVRTTQKEEDSSECRDRNVIDEVSAGSLVKYLGGDPDDLSKALMRGGFYMVDQSLITSARIKVNDDLDWVIDKCNEHCFEKVL